MNYPVKTYLLTISLTSKNQILINDGFDFQRGLTPPYVDDGQLEIVGFRDAWHGLVLLAPNGHGTRLAQV